MAESQLEVNDCSLHKGQLLSRFHVNDQLTSVFDWGVSILVLLGILEKIIIFGILDIF